MIYANIFCKKVQFLTKKGKKEVLSVADCDDLGDTSTGALI